MGNGNLNQELGQGLKGSEGNHTHVHVDQPKILPLFLSSIFSLLLPPQPEMKNDVFYRCSRDADAIPLGLEFTFVAPPHFCLLSPSLQGPSARLRCSSASALLRVDAMGDISPKH